MIERIQNNFKIIVEFTWILFGNIINTIGLLAVTKILSSQLPQSSFGLYYLGTTLSIFATQILFGPFGNGFSRFFWIANDRNELELFLSQSIYTIKWLTVIFLIVSIGLYFSIKNIYQINILMFFCFIIIAICSSYTALLYAYFNIIRKRKIIAFYQLVESVLKISFLFVIIFFYDKTIMNFLYSLTFASIFIVNLQFLKIKSILIPNKNITRLVKQKTWIREIAYFSYPFAIWGIFTWFQMSSDRYFLGYFTSSAKVAEYAIIFQLGYYPPSLLIGNFVQTVTPILYQKVVKSDDLISQKNSSKLINKMSYYSILLVILGFLIMFLFSRIIIDILAHKKYLNVSNYLPYMFLSGGIFSTAQILSIDYQSKMRMKELMWIKVITSFIGITFSYLCIKSYGLTGAVYSSVLFSFIYILAIWYYSKFKI
jgi:O-antigen/teichoic acid export membrane protein